MTPEEKAKEMVDTFERATGPNTGVVGAAVCCDEIISVLQAEDADWLTSVMNKSLRYWNMVKDHIQSL